MAPFFLVIGNSPWRVRHGDVYTNPLSTACKSFTFHCFLYHPFSTELRLKMNGPFDFLFICSQLKLSPSGNFIFSVTLNYYFLSKQTRFSSFRMFSPQLLLLPSVLYTFLKNSVFPVVSVSQTYTQNVHIVLPETASLSRRERIPLLM